MDDYTILSFAFVLDGEKPKNLISIGHTSKDDFENNVLTISAESEENLSKFLKLL